MNATTFSVSSDLRFKIRRDWLRKLLSLADAQINDEGLDSVTIDSIRVNNDTGHVTFESARVRQFAVRDVA